MELKPEDLVISKWSGHHRGGWSVAPLSGIQIVHRPTGAMVQVDKDRSIHKNKVTAMKMLENKVDIIMKAKKQQATLSKAQIDAIVYQCRQSGNDTTYDIVAACLAASQQSSTAKVGMVAVPANKLTYDDCARFGISIPDIRALSAQPAAQQGDGELPQDEQVGQINPHFATFPEKIWLNVGDGDADEVGPYQDLSDLSWCWEAIYRYDVAYVRADLAQRVGSGEAIGFIVQHDASGGNFFTAVKSYEEMRKTYGDQCRLVYTAPPAAVQPSRNKLIPMQSDEDQEAGIVRQWYFDCDGHYIDVALDNGKYSVFFRDRATQGEGWLDQSEQPDRGRDAALEVFTIPHVTSRGDRFVLESDALAAQPTENAAVQSLTGCDCEQGQCCHVCDPDTDDVQSLMDAEKLDARRAMFRAYSECLTDGANMLPQEIADKLLAAASAKAKK